MESIVLYKLKEKKMNRKTKFIESPFLAIGYTWLLLMGYGIIYFAYLSPFSAAKNGEELSLFTHFTILFFSGILPTIIFIFYIHRGASVIELSKTGIKKSLFKIFYRREIKWEELTEMRIIHRVNVWLFVSKVSMKNYSYEQLVKRKDTIQMTMSKKLYDTIRQYTSQEIIGIEEDSM
jgi:hypothetical protein